MKAAENCVELHVGRATHLVHVPLTTLCGWLDPTSSSASTARSS